MLCLQGSGFKVMGPDFRRESISVSDWVKHKGVVNQAHIYMQT